MLKCVNVLFNIEKKTLIKKKRERQSQKGILIMLLR